jgi:hypothetical protein
MFKKTIFNFIRIIQKILIVLALTVVYFLGLGITLVFLIVFKRNLLTNASRAHKSFWVNSEGCEPDLANNLRQS